MKLLNAVFSYNRYQLLHNTIESLLEFGPEGDLVIFDDGSDDVRLKEYLTTIQKDKRGVVLYRDHQSHLHGGLYNNMDRAVEYAVGGTYSHIFFLQDDVQFMWKDSRFFERVEDIFKHTPDVSMVLPFFYKAIIEPVAHERLVPNPDTKCWYSKPYGICDIGIIPVELLRQRKFRFSTLQSATKNGSLWLSWGYKAYLMSTPILAWVPWPLVKLGSGYTFGEEREPKQKYFLKPLSKEQQDKLLKTSEDLTSIPYTEDYCFPWGWKCLSPYWFTRGKKEYVHLLLKGMISGRGRWPRWVGRE